MEGPHDPRHPGQDAGAPQPEEQDGDLHALLERLLGQGDVRPSAPGAGEDLWPDVFAAAPAADEVSTIVPAPDAPAVVPELPAALEDAVAAGTTTDVDDIHAAILASVSVDLEPVAPEAPAEPELDLSAYLAIGPAPSTAAVDEPAGAAFTLTPCEGTETHGAAPPHPDDDAPWPVDAPELGLDVAPLLDLDAVDEPADEDAPAAATAVVLPWPSHEARAVEPASTPPQDLIEAALSGLHADLTSEPVEPLRTPDVALSTAHVVFRLGSRRIAIPLAAVSEIARPPKVTRLPHVPAWVLGIANLRGDIVSMLDLEGFLSGKVGKSSHEQRMLALRPAGDEVRTAVLVDSVDGIQAFEDARISRVTRGYDAAVAPYARGLYQVDDDLVVVLDADRLLQSKPMRQFEDGAGAR
jgi:twitching motility protein PilI